MSQDIRDRDYADGEAVLSLNFINETGPLTFRKYHRSGLRSLIFEVVSKVDVQKETRGEVVDGIRMFPRARPLKIFRIFRTRVDSIEKIFKEIERYRHLLTYLGPDLLARSEEFMASYEIDGSHRILFCGLQEYVPGEILDPWRPWGKGSLAAMFSAAPNPEQATETARKQLTQFLKKIRNMIHETGYIPDLAGVGNLVLTPEGRLKLVDINNIVKLTFDDEIPLDDRDYPACDVTIQALARLETHILGRPVDMSDPLYRHFLPAQRQARAKVYERLFYQSLDQRG